jgi:hypothetical protein
MSASSTAVWNEMVLEGCSNGDDPERAARDDRTATFVTPKRR